MFNFFEKSDSKIQEDVISQLMWDPSINNTRINVTAKDGIVTLRGTVPHFVEKVWAEEIAQKVGGVRAVADEIEVDIDGSFVKSDEEIAEAALSALKWNYSVPDTVKVAVAKAWITLRGEVEWDYQRNEAKNAVRDLIGVRGVVNSITLKPTIQKAVVKTRIEEALKRSAETEGRKISVAVDGTTVTLSGNVESASEIQNAALAAWNAPGVNRVDNKLKLAQ